MRAQMRGQNYTRGKCKSSYGLFVVFVRTVDAYLTLLHCRITNVVFFFTKYSRITKHGYNNMNRNALLRLIRANKERPW